MTTSPDDSPLPAGATPEAGIAKVAGVGVSPSGDRWGVKFWRSYIENLTRLASFQWEKDHLGGASYVFAKGLAQQMADLTPKIYRPMLDAYLKSPATQKMLRSDTMAYCFEMIGQQIELIKESRRLLGFPVKDAELFDKKYNHQFLAEDVYGNIVAVTEEQLLALFPQTDPVTGEVPKQFPRVVITSSHASGETLKDVTQITHGIERTISDATQGKTKFAQIDTSCDDLGVKPDQTLILYRCDVRQNPWLNGAALLRRINELKECEKTGKPDQFKETSPGSWAINHLMLAWMSHQPQQVLAAKYKPLGEYYAQSAEPIELRSDAGRIAQHFMLDGYSKAGTVVSDAGPRLLPHELQVQNAAGKDLFHCEQESEMQPITKDGIYEVRNIVRQIPTWAAAAVEVGLTDAQIAAGATRVAFNSSSDEISSHSNYEGRRHDERWIIDGVVEDNGHAPVAALGSRDGSGYAMNNPRVRRRMEELCAPMIGKATLEGIRFDTGNASEVRLEVGAGTSDRLVENHRQTILTALAEAGLGGAVISNPHPYSGEFLLKFPRAVTNQPSEMQKLETAFHALREHAEGLVICERLLNDDIAAQVENKGINNAGHVVSGVVSSAKVVADAPAPSGFERGGD